MTDMKIETLQRRAAWVSGIIETGRAALCLQARCKSDGCTGPQQCMRSAETQDRRQTEDSPETFPIENGSLFRVRVGSRLENAAGVDLLVFGN